jgi:hypothetical protein
MLNHEKMFGFKHTMNGFNYNEQKAIRSRTAGRLLQVQGPACLEGMYPFLVPRLDAKFKAAFGNGVVKDGMSRYPIISMR